MLSFKERESRNERLPTYLRTYLRTSQTSGLEKDQFNTCFDSQTYKESIDNDVKLAHSQGFFDTPSFIVVDSIDGSDPEIIRGAQPFPAFQSVIEKKLDELKE